MPQTDARLALVQQWLSADLRLQPQRVEPASSDASFRRYFRVYRQGETLIVMDAPPGKEDVRAYLLVTRLLEEVGVHVPRVHEADEGRGLLLLEDLGSTDYLTRLRAGDDPERLYGDALGALAQIQTRGLAAATQLAPYDRPALARELALMPEWFCARHLRLTLSSAETQLIDASFELLIREALAQPAVFVHRDYHSRNLMLVSERNPGIIDFQDALRGPVGYDLVSLLKDCYIGWPRERVEEWVRNYRQLLRRAGGEAGSGELQFLRWFDLIGLQRHIKVLGIFARLWYRDGKPGYLRDLPLTLHYVRDTCERYAELGEFGAWIEQRLVGPLAQANAGAMSPSAQAARALPKAPDAAS